MTRLQVKRDASRGRCTDLEDLLILGRQTLLLSPPRKDFFPEIGTERDNFGLYADAICKCLLGFGIACCVAGRFDQRQATAEVFVLV